MTPEELFQQLERHPWTFDFYQAMRRLEAMHPKKPRFGQALRPVDEPVRLGQEPSLGFAPSSISVMEPAKAGRPPRLQVRFFGLLGPNGPLPLHLTEFAVERRIHDHDRTFARFLDILHHRFLLMFYRAWAQGQPAVNFDRPPDDHFATYVGSLFGAGTPRLRKRDVLGDYAKMHVAGNLARQVRNRDGLEQLLRGYFRVPARVEEFVGHWMRLPSTERMRLGQLGGTLGRDAVVGASVWDRQHKIRIHLGPLTRAQYEGFLPGTTGAARLLAWLRYYLGLEFAWDVRLVLARNEVPRARLGRTPSAAKPGEPVAEDAPCRVGWVSWLGQRHRNTDAADLTLQLEDRQRSPREDSSLHSNR
jgi:type VI secretion system protein ImpH